MINLVKQFMDSKVQVSIIKRAKNDYCVSMVNFDLPNKGSRYYDFTDLTQAIYHAKNLFECYGEKKPATKRKGAAGVAQKVAWLVENM